MEKTKKRKFDDTKDKIQKIIHDTDFLNKIKDECECYIDEDELIDIIHQSLIEPINRCLICNCDMGKNNPRQLCGKTFCLEE
tara:strand:- start:93 stop:338 length:246 start_codon:yes stop_codon:yes gene_type:complete